MLWTSHTTGSSARMNLAVVTCGVVVVIAAAASAGARTGPDPAAGAVVCVIPSRNAPYMMTPVPEPAQLSF